METIELKLRERIKELTCLYEISSIIGNTDTTSLPNSLQAILKSLKKAFQYPEFTEIAISYDDHYLATGSMNNKLTISSSIQLFNKHKGALTASLKEEKSSFLKEEKQLIDSVALKISNLLERIEIKKNENSLRRQIERTDRLNILGEITAGIAHELNTPLTNILGFSELLKEELSNKDHIAKDVDKIIQNAIYSREVVKKLMFFACEMPQEREIIDIVPTIKSAIDLLKPTLQKKEIQCIVKTENKLFLKADVLQLTQVIFNLVMNAIYFTPENGKIMLSAFRENTTIVLKVIDEGIGLSEDVKEKLFEPFITTKPIGQGSGLGLSVVHGIVASHQGEITAKNNTHKGATFQIILPVN
ncbi:sensor histidine kinase [Mesonia aestuariivivens]|uniref:histidine kinase n=1 Tax=Mesonia aestuariivivens TaxID=2796128 RepID=A0ABS6W643_9FLAO|nr:HAMP domain-containing sensor histidine kinase [Mesonia aestuariivivens]MBW2963017.1 HAMP domain-containing histidine kinase [Mesonia aestuariivivens]